VGDGPEGLCGLASSEHCGRCELGESKSSEKSHEAQEAQEVERSRVYSSIGDLEGEGQGRVLFVQARRRTKEKKGFKFGCPLRKASEMDDQLGEKKYHRKHLSN
jgi:hypothetical protein